MVAAGWDRGKGEPRRWDMIVVLGASTSLQGKQSLPGDSESWRSWCGFCIAGHRGLPYSRGQPVCAAVEAKKPKRLWGNNKYNYV